MNNLKQCWLSPRGDIVTDSKEFETNSWHLDLALCILRDIWGMKSKREAQIKIEKMRQGKHATQILEEIGWIRLNITDGRSYWIDPHIRNLTKEQESVVLDWAITHNKRYEEAFYKF